MPNGTYVLEKYPVGYVQQTVSNTAVALTSVPSTASRAVVIVETNGIRTRDDGTDPTSSVGMPYAAAAVIELVGRRVIDQFKAIRSSGSDAIINVSYYRS